MARKNDKPKEEWVKNEVKKILDATPRTLYFMPVAGMMNGIGISDFIGCSQGRFFAIETKRDDKHKPTLVQRMFLATVRTAGGYAMVIHKDNIQKVNDMLNEIAAETT